MSSKKQQRVQARFDAIVGGGQAIGTLDDGRKVFAWGVLPGETAEVVVTKKKSRYVEGVADTIVTPNSELRINPVDPGSYLSTSPWQIMNFEAEQHYKAALIEEAFELHDIVLPDPIEVYSDGKEFRYRNKVEFSWYGRTDEAAEYEHLDLAFFRRGGRGKIIVEDSALLPEPVVALAREIRDYLETLQVPARLLKTLLIRCDANGNCVWQLYVKTEDFAVLSAYEAGQFSAQGGEVIYSNPKSPASIITNRLLSVGDTVLKDTVLGVPFRYATEGFFQINLPVYEQALKDMRTWIPADMPVVDLYSGVGSIGLTIGGDDVVLVEINEHAVREMRRNISDLKLNATPVLAASEQALEYIRTENTIIVDPPRAGLHEAVVERLLSEKPQRIIYLSCNPVTQARDVARLGGAYGVKAHKGYNFFPRTPHIEHLVILDLKP